MIIQYQQYQQNIVIEGKFVESQVLSDSIIHWKKDQKTGHNLFTEENQLMNSFPENVSIINSSEDKKEESFFEGINIK